MVEPQSLEAELGAMRDELSRGAEPGVGEASSSKAAPRACCGLEFDSLLREIEVKWGEASGNAEELVKSHPVAALVSAFLVGVAVGRLMGHAK